MKQTLWTTSKENNRD